eukprot:TRINITY_DN6583_c0_g1_i6.p1 TRINITY_DN6583_c0_g1~~TRINITY_DN6583_c0_g1_i6.p1  ORF type:complete len:689 (+),score=253.30 TRINITY_DN6583_c0_g1_i6:332-2398(+)
MSSSSGSDSQRRAARSSGSESDSDGPANKQPTQGRNAKEQSSSEEDSQHGSEEEGQQRNIQHEEVVQKEEVEREEEEVKEEREQEEVKQVQEEKEEEDEKEEVIEAEQARETHNKEEEEQHQPPQEQETDKQDDTESTPIEKKEKDKEKKKKLNSSKKDSPKKKETHKKEEKKEEKREEKKVDKKLPVKKEDTKPKEVTRHEIKEKELAGWELTQKKAFTHWINSFLSLKGLKIEELGTDFKNTILFITFIECLTGMPFGPKYHTKPKLKVHHLENAQLAIAYLKSSKVPDITISPDEIVDGNIKMMLGFCWVLLRFFGKQQMQRNATGDSKNDNISFEDILLNWVRDNIADYELDLINFKTSFNDGRVLLALCHKLNPELIDYDNTDLSDPRTNVDTAMKLIEQQYKVPPLLHTDDVIEGKESDKNTVLYLSLVHGAWSREVESKKASDVTQEKVLSLQERLTQLQEENVALKEEKSTLHEQIEELKNRITESSQVLVEIKESKEEQKMRITTEKEELRVEKEKLEKEKQELDNENESLVSKLRRQQRAKEELEEAVKKEQAKMGIAIQYITKFLLEHLKDLEDWKAFIERDREYKKEDVPIPAQADIQKLSNDDQILQLCKLLMTHSSSMEGILAGREAFQKEQAQKAALPKEKPVEIVNKNIASVSSKQRKSTGNLTDREIKKKS